MTTIREPDTRWPVAGLFLDALVRRDFAALAACLDPDVRFRALLPRGAAQWIGAEEAVRPFAGWFGEAEDFEVLDASIGHVGARLYLRWRVRLTRDGTAYVAEQHMFATATDRVSTLDLLCSGFQVQS